MYGTPMVAGITMTGIEETVYIYRCVNVGSWPGEGLAMDKVGIHLLTLGMKEADSDPASRRGRSYVCVGEIYSYNDCIKHYWVTYRRRWFGIRLMGIIKTGPGSYSENINMA